MFRSYAVSTVPHPFRPSLNVYKQGLSRAYRMLNERTFDTAARRSDASKLGFWVLGIRPLTLQVIVAKCKFRICAECIRE